jgi:hypothetical protein
MKLFDDIVRDFAGPALFAEPGFTYLNRSARLSLDRVRAVLEDWFEHYPAPHQADLRGRFRSGKDRQHCSAFFELLLHELLLRRGCCVEVHPQTGKDAPKRPDFLVESPDGELFYLEAVLATAESAEAAAARSRMNDVYDALNRLHSPDFFIGMNVHGAPEAPVPAKQIRAFLKAKMDELDADAVAECWRTGTSSAVPH